MKVLPGVDWRAKSGELDFCDEEALTTHGQWTPLLPTAKGFCSFVQNFLKEIFGVKVKLSEVQNAVCDAFNTTWNVLSANEVGGTTDKMFNIMSMTLSYGRGKFDNAVLSTPLDGVYNFLVESQSEDLYNVQWGGLCGSMPVISASLSDDGEPPLGLKFAYNIDPLTTEDEKVRYLSFWQDFGLANTFL
jgi:hypothetical protein